MEIIQIASKLPWDKSIGRRKLTDIKYAIVHHDAALAFDGVQDVTPRYISEANYHIGKGWGHLGYSFKIAHDGKVYQTVPLEECGAQAGNYSYFKNSFGICLDGDFSKQKPSDAQLNALRSLMDHLAHHSPELPGITHSSFYAHKEVRVLPTFCPGDVVKAVVKDYRINGK